MKTTCMIATAALLVVAVSSAGTANLVVNPDFDTDLSGWGHFGGTWSPFDWQDSPTSGSSNKALSTAGATVPIADQCVELGGTPAQEYELSAQVYIPSGQTGTGSAHISVGWFSSPACINQVSGDDSADVTATGSWVELADTLQPPPGAVSMHLGVYLWAQTGGGFEAYTDHVVLKRSEIFADGFESGDVDGWSLSPP